MIKPTHVKICGITRAEDGQEAACSGAFAIGLILAPSARQVTVAQVREIVQSMPQDFLCIGVFFNASREFVAETVRRTGLRGVQLHGTESADDVRHLKDSHPDLKVIKTIGIGSEGLELNPRDYQDADYLLFDSIAPRTGLGARSLLDWRKIEPQSVPKPFFVAGGLRAENVKEIITELQPFGVDVSSGVESLPGLKDSGRLHRFFEAVGGSHDR